MQLHYCAYPHTCTAHTFSITGAGSYSSVCVTAFSGTRDNLPSAFSDGAAGSGGDIQPGGGTPAYANSLIVSGLAIGQNTTAAIDSGCTTAQQVALKSGTAKAAPWRISCRPACRLL